MAPAALAKHVAVVAGLLLAGAATAVLAHLAFIEVGREVVMLRNRPDGRANVSGRVGAKATRAASSSERGR